MFLLKKSIKNITIYNAEKGSFGVKVIVLLSLAIIFISLIKPYSAFADVYGRADVSYQETTTSTAGKTTESYNLFQAYSLGFNHALTSTIMLTADVRLVNNDINGRETEDIFPTFYLNFRPPAMYYLSFSYNRSENIPPDGDPITTSNTNASFLLPLEGWPSLALSYNYSTMSDYLSPHKIDNTYSVTNFNTGYNFSFLETATNLNYSYTYPVAEDNVAETRTENPSQNVTANFSRSFGDGKVQTSANIGYNESQSINESKGLPIRFEQEITAADGLYLLDATPLIGALTSTPALIDNNTSASAGIDPLDTGTFRNIGIKLTTAESVAKIHLNLSTTDPNISTYVNTPAVFVWQLYTSNDGTSWTLFSGTLTTAFESAFQRIVFTFAETSALYFKVVNTAFPAGALPINVTEIEAIRFINSTPTTRLTYTTKRDFGGFNISYSPITILNLNYTINYDHSYRDLYNFDSTGINQSVGLNAVIMPQYLNLATNYTTATNKTKEERTSGAISTTEFGSNSYAITFSSIPLPTVNASLNYGYSESLTSGTIDSTNNSVSGNVFMNLYKGVDLGLGSTLSESKSLKANSTTDSTSYYSNLSLVPWKPVTVVINGWSTTTQTTGVGSSTTNSLITNFSYTPTRTLYLLASITIEPASSQSYSVNWLPTRNTQVSARYGISGDVTNMGGDFSWTPIQRLSLRVGYVGTTTDNATSDHTESIFASASLSL